MCGRSARSARATLVGCRAAISTELGEAQPPRALVGVLVEEVVKVAAGGQAARRTSRPAVGQRALRTGNFTWPAAS